MTKEPEFKIDVDGDMPEVVTVNGERYFRVHDIPSMQNAMVIDEIKRRFSITGAEAAWIIYYTDSYQTNSPFDYPIVEEVEND